MEKNVRLSVYGRVQAAMQQRIKFERLRFWGTKNLQKEPWPAKSAKEKLTVSNLDLHKLSTFFKVLTIS